MTRIKSTVTNNSFHILLDGHAGYDERGKDIVCSAISTLSCFLMYSLNKAKENGEIINLQVENESGHIDIYFDFSENEKSIRDIAQNVIECFKILSEQYPKNIKII